MALRSQVESADTYGRSLSKAPQTAEARGAAIAHARYMTEDEQRAWRVELAGAEQRVRRLANRHTCSRVRTQDPPCHHPRHDLDWADGLQVLIALGILPDQRAPRTALGTVSKAATTAPCATCGRMISKRSDGRMCSHPRHHSQPATAPRCPGTGQPPKEATP